MKLKRFSKFLVETKDNPIKSSLGNFLASIFNEPRKLTNKEFIDLFYEGVFSFIKEYLSDHDLEEISKEEIDNAVSDNIKRKIPSYDPKNSMAIDYLLDIKDEKLLAIPNLIYNHYVFYHYKDYFIFNLASRTDSWKDEQIEYHLILDLFSSLEDLNINFELIQDINFIFKLKKENKLSLDFFNKFPKNPFSKLTLRSLDFSNKQLKKLPSDLPNVQETFDCFFNQLITLKGSPKMVGGDFNCYKNQLTSLEGAPKVVGGEFDCSHNELTSLEGAPEFVGGDFNCYKNQLTSLEGAPKVVGGNFYCYGHPKKFIEEEIRVICKVGGKVEV